MRNVAAEEDRAQHMRLVQPPLVFPPHTIRCDVGNQHRRSFSWKRRTAVGAIETEHPDHAHMIFIGRDDLEVVDEMS